MSTVNIAVITGLTPPVTGAKPVMSLPSNGQYAATVVWGPPDDPFKANTIYTATITIVPDSGWDVAAVPADFFTVAGATSVKNPAGSVTVTAVFPATAAATSTPVNKKIVWTVCCLVAALLALAGAVFYRMGQANPIEQKITTATQTAAQATKATESLPPTWVPTAPPPAPAPTEEEKAFEINLDSLLRAELENEALLSLTPESEKTIRGLVDKYFANPKESPEKIKQVSVEIRKVGGDSANKLMAVYAVKDLRSPVRARARKWFATYSLEAVLERLESRSVCRPQVIIREREVAPQCCPPPCMKPVPPAPKAPALKVVPPKAAPPKVTPKATPNPAPKAPASVCPRHQQQRTSLQQNRNEGLLGQIREKEDKLSLALLERNNANCDAVYIDFDRIAKRLKDEIALLKAKLN